MITIQKIDYEPLLTIMRESVESFPKLDNEVVIVDYTNRLFNNAEFCITQIDNRIIGIIAFYANRIPNAYISHIYVSKKYRNQGFCGKMLTAIIEYVKVQKFTNIKLEVDKNNVIALSFYQAHGFSLLEERSAKYLMSLNI